MSAHWVWIVVTLYGSLAWVATTWIRARYGGGDAGSSRRSRRVPNLREELEARDLEIARLERRVRVLERIATDPKAELEREFERLQTGA